MHWQEEYCDSPTLNTVGCINLVDCLLNSIKKYKHAIAQIEFDGSKKITFKEIKSKTLLAANRLSYNGIKFGDIVAICSPNNTDYCWEILAILNTGAACFLIPPTITPSELIHSLSITKPVAVIGQNLNAHQLEVFLKTESVKHIWTDNVPNVEIKCKSFSDLLKDFVDNNNSNWSGLCPSDGADPAFILSSSGSTGLPKGVVLTHNNFIAMLSQNSHLFMKSGTTALGLMPFYHAYGLGLMLMALFEGSKMVVLPKFSLRTFLNVISIHKVTHLHIVPSLMITLAKSPEATPELLSSLQEVYTGAGAVLTKHQRALMSKLSSKTRLYHTYGMTETTFVVLYGECRYDKPGSAGKLIQGFTAKIISKNGNEIKGEIGELLLKGPTIMSRYFDNPEATAKAIDKNRWLHTGDLAYFDNDGYFYIVDRIKDMIKYQGFQISPTELELVLLKHEGVSQVAVVGEPHNLYGEVPKAYVVRNNNDKPVSEEELQNLIKEELSAYKQLRGGVCFVDHLPNSPTGKIKKKCLKNSSK